MPSDAGRWLPLLGDHWVVRIRENLAEVLAADVENTRVSIFNVPEPLRSGKSVAYSPQVIAVGPYHHWQPQLYEMEQSKLSAARRFQPRLPAKRLDDVAQRFAERAGMIRAHYIRYLDMDDETLSWMMVVDTCFLVEFLEAYAPDGPVLPPSTFHLYCKHGHASTNVRIGVLQDLMMLENQLPLFLLKDIITMLEGSLEGMLKIFMADLMPFKSMAVSPAVDLATRPHLLDVLYHMIVPSPAPFIANGHSDNGDTVGFKEETSMNPPRFSSNIKLLLKAVYATLSNVPVGFVKDALRPVTVAMKLPWGLLRSVFSPSSNPDTPDAGDGEGKPPLVEEILIPSAMELMKAGVKFRPTDGGLSSIDFDVKTSVFTLPAITLDTSTEVILRNLVAYEASAFCSPLVLARYTELMNGIVDTEDDARLLRHRGIIVNRMKDDEDVVELWNGMSKSTRLTKVEHIDAAIKGVNGYYYGRWRVKAKQVVTRYLYNSWRLLAIVATVLLLVLNSFQAFCSVYECGKWTKNS